MGAQDALTTRATRGDHVVLELVHMITSSVNKQRNLTRVVSMHPQAATLQLIPGRESRETACSRAPFFIVTFYNPQAAALQLIPGRDSREAASSRAPLFVGTHSDPQAAALQLIPSRELHEGARSEAPFHP